MTSGINQLTNADQNLILTGYTGPSQPAIGRALAKRLGRSFVNFEFRLEEHIGMSLDEIRATYGATRLKNLEGELLNEIVLYRGAVIRVSGETLSYGDNLDRLAATGPVLCLVAPLDMVLRRLHLQMGTRYHDPAERDMALGQLRQAWFARGKPGVHDVDVTDLNETETVERLEKMWQTLALQRG